MAWRAEAGRSGAKRGEYLGTRPHPRRATTGSHDSVDIRECTISLRQFPSPRQPGAGILDTPCFDMRRAYGMVKMDKATL